MLPCADCEGIDTALFLEKDGTWVMNQHYQGAKGRTVFASYGTWARTADKLVLTDSDGEKQYFRARGEALEMLDREGNAITSSLNYRLEPGNDPLPETPMTMTGMYQDDADTATFTDCATKRQAGVANHAALERDYLAARGTGQKPVLLVVEAHFSMTVSPTNGTVQKQLVTDRNVAFKPGKDCDNP
ncbi:Copper homeostasis protein CutF precursor / Lipoprotein NlpE involeved in surface adhesion [Cronobacter condimenti 1330]|uniref:Copper homeostasis protein CutF / Lipoprotein NlpE involeved in surface adhesion n=1 Tax=Cronobacter condimenti 1330 TaxID=1073999 RepID=K8A717_9ENTR|nr:Copper homeostasis protein CutF precursor / Lipoprotein NlpE involeved in surface adhesion [Cronobacter condimenti 1330]